MMETLEQLKKVCILMSSNKQITWEKTIIGFVDDKRQYTNDWINNDLDTTNTNLQEASQVWEHLLHTTGGQLKLSKCAWYCISWNLPHIVYLS